MKRMQTRPKRVASAKGSEITIKDGEWTRATAKPLPGSRPLPSPRNR